MSSLRCYLIPATLALCLLTACPGGAKVDPAKAQAMLVPRAPKLPSGWPIPEFKPPAGLQQVKLTPQLLAAIAARSGSVTPDVSGDGYEIDAKPYKQGEQDDGLAGISGSATATDAPDATDRARPKHHGQYTLFACTGAADWDKLAGDTENAMKAAGYRRIESGDGPEGEAARFINDDETSMAVLVHRVPRDDHQEFGVKEEFVYMACTLEKPAPRPDTGSD